MNEDRDDRPREGEQDCQPERPMSLLTVWLLWALLTLFILTWIGGATYGACASR